MRLLLDTHIVLWAATDPAHLKDAAREVLEDGTHDVLVSMATAWEIAIKQSLGKLELPKPAEQWLPEVLRRTGFEVAQLGLRAALRVRGLPWLHRDPFDRLLAAQALEESYPLVTRDEAFSRYGVPVIEGRCSVACASRSQSTLNLSDSIQSPTGPGCCIIQTSCAVVTLPVDLSNHDVPNWRGSWSIPPTHCPESGSACRKVVTYSR